MVRKKIKGILGNLPREAKIAIVSVVVVVVGLGALGIIYKRFFTKAAFTTGVFNASDAAAVENKRLDSDDVRDVYAYNTSLDNDLGAWTNPGGAVDSPWDSTGQLTGVVDNNNSTSKFYDSFVMNETGVSGVTPGQEYKMWVSHYGSIDQEKYIALFTSPDGKAWTRVGEVNVFNYVAQGTNAGARETSNPTVINDNGIYKMWFTAWSTSSAGIAYTESIDAAHPLTFKQPQTGFNGWPRVFQHIGVTAAGTQCSPSVIKDPTAGYRMYFNGQCWPAQNPPNPDHNMIYSATSPNLVDGGVWTPTQQGTAVPGDNLMEPSVVYNDDTGKYVMFFNKNFDHLEGATSTDGVNFTVDPALAFNAPSPYYVFGGAGVIKDGNKYRTYYTSATGNNRTIAYAEKKLPINVAGISWFNNGSKYTDNSFYRYGPTPLISNDTRTYGSLDPTVVIDTDPATPEGERYKMWYQELVSTVTSPVIGYATSADGLSWKADLAKRAIDGSASNLVYDDAAPNSRPTVVSPFIIKDGGVYKMWAQGNFPLSGNRIVYGESSTGSNFQFPGSGRGSKAITGSSAVTGGMCSPSVIKEGASSYVMFAISPCATDNGNLRKYTSTDGISWTDAGLVMSGTLKYTNVHKDGSDYVLWFTAADGQNKEAKMAIGGVQFTLTGLVLKGSATSADDAGQTRPIVAIDNGTMKVWYTGQHGGYFSTSYAEFEPLQSGGPFPAKASIVATPKGIEIIDASNNTRYMRFLATDSNSILSKDSSTVPYSVVAKNGKIYIGTFSGLHIIDFINDKVYKVDGIGTKQYIGKIADANKGNGYGSSIAGSYKLTGQVVRDVSVAKVDNTTTYVAVLHEGETTALTSQEGTVISLLNENAPTEKRVIYGAAGTFGRIFNNIHLSENGTLYASHVASLGNRIGGGTATALVRPQIIADYKATDMTAYDTNGEKNILAGEGTGGSFAYNVGDTLATSETDQINDIVTAPNPNSAGNNIVIAGTSKGLVEILENRTGSPSFEYWRDAANTGLFGNNPLKENQVNAVAIKTDGTYAWAGHEHEGIAEINLATKQVKYEYTAHSDIGVSSNRITALSYGLGDGDSIVAGTNSGINHVFKFNPNPDTSSQEAVNYFGDEITSSSYYDRTVSSPAWNGSVVGANGAPDTRWHQSTETTAPNSQGDSAVIKETDGTYKMWASDGAGNIRYFTSSNGIDWVGGSIAIAKDATNSYGHPSVVNIGNSYHIYLSRSTLRTDGFTRYSMSHAISSSTDGSTFGPLSPLAFSFITTYNIGNPSAINDNGTVQLYFIKDNTGAPKEFYVASNASPDTDTGWTAPSLVLSAEAGQFTINDVNVVKDNSVYQMYYSLLRTSTSGSHAEIVNIQGTAYNNFTGSRNTVLTVDQAWDGLGSITSPTVVFDALGSGKHMMWYVASGFTHLRTAVNEGLTQGGATFPARAIINVMRSGKVQILDADTGNQWITFYPNADGAGTVHESAIAFWAQHIDGNPANPGEIGTTRAFMHDGKLYANSRIGISIINFKDGTIRVVQADGEHVYNGTLSDSNSRLGFSASASGGMRLSGSYGVIVLSAVVDMTFISDGSTQLLGYVGTTSSGGNEIKGFIDINNPTDNRQFLNNPTYSPGLRYDNVTFAKMPDGTISMFVVEVPAASYAVAPLIHTYPDVMYNGTTDASLVYTGASGLKVRNADNTPDITGTMLGLGLTDKINGIAVNSTTGAIYIATSVGVKKFLAGSVTSLTADPALSIQASGNDVYIGTATQGLLKMTNDATPTVLYSASTTPVAIASNKVNSFLLTKDSSNNDKIIIGTDKGMTTIGTRITIGDQDNDGIPDAQDFCPLPYQHEGIADNDFKKEDCYLSRITVVDGHSGLVKTPDGKVSIDFPPNSISAGSIITLVGGEKRYIIGDGTTDPSMVLGNYEFQPSGVNFTTPVTVTMSYEDKDADGFVDNTNKIPVTDIKIFRKQTADATTGVWSSVCTQNDLDNGNVDTFCVDKTNQARDIAMRQVTFRTGHFTVFNFGSSISQGPTVDLAKTINSNTVFAGNGYPGSVVNIFKAGETSTVSNLIQLGAGQTAPTATYVPEVAPQPSIGGFVDNFDTGINSNIWEINGSVTPGNGKATMFVDTGSQMASVRNRLGYNLPAPVIADGSYTSLLLHGDGATITDSSNYAHPVQILGSVATTTADSKFGGSAIKFNGGSDQLKMPLTDDLRLGGVDGTEDFTIDFWAKFDNPGAPADFFSIRDDAGGFKFHIQYYPGQGFQFWDGGSWVHTNSFTPTAGQWYHLAYQRRKQNSPQATTDGTTPRVNTTAWDAFIDGQIQNSATIQSHPITLTGNGLYAQIGNLPDYGRAFSGTIDEFRITKGIARYKGYYDNWGNTDLNSFTPAIDAYVINNNNAPGVTGNSLVAETDVTIDSRGSQQGFSAMLILDNQVEGNNQPFKNAIMEVRGNGIYFLYNSSTVAGSTLGGPLLPPFDIPAGTTVGLKIEVKPGIIELSADVGNDGTYEISSGNLPFQGWDVGTRIGLQANKDTGDYLTTSWDNLVTTFPAPGSPGTPAGFSFSSAGMALNANGVINEYKDPAPFFGGAPGIFFWGTGNPTQLPATIPASEVPTDIYVYLTKATIAADTWGPGVPAVDTTFRWTVYAAAPEYFGALVQAINAQGIPMTVDAFAKVFGFNPATASIFGIIPKVFAATDPFLTGETLPATSLGTIDATGTVVPDVPTVTGTSIARTKVNAQGEWTAYFGYDENGNIIPGLEAKDESGAVIPGAATSIFDVAQPPFDIFVESNGIKSPMLAVTTDMIGIQGEAIDRIPPTTTVTVVGINEIAPNDAYYKDSATVTLSATDNVGGSGIASTEYSLVGATNLGWTAYTGEININALGATTIKVKSTDVAGNVEIEKEVVVSIDKDSDGDSLYDNFDSCPTVSGQVQFNGCATSSTIPPTTTANVTGTLESSPYDTVYIDQATVELTAIDDVGGAGVSNTEYYLSGAITNPGSYTQYTGAITINVEGITTVHFRSTDFTGNVESENTLAIAIDKDSDNDGLYNNFDACPTEAGGIERNGCPAPADQTAPVTTASIAGTKEDAPYDSYYKDTATVTLTATDEGSGVANTKYSLSGATTLAETTYTIPIVITELGETTITFHSTDTAGNIENDRIVFAKIDKDSDGDGIYDQADECALVAGRAEFGGCAAAISYEGDLHILYTGKVVGYAGLKNGQQKKEAKISLVPGAVGDSRGESITTLHAKVYKKSDLQVQIGTNNFDDNVKKQCKTIYDTKPALEDQDITASPQLINILRPDNYVLALRVDITDPVDGVVRSTTSCKQVSTSDFNYDYNKNGTADPVAKRKMKVIKTVKKTKVTVGGQQIEKDDEQIDDGDEDERHGSLLSITHPAEAQWEDGMQTYIYPYFFESDSDWVVDVCASAPVGYVISGVYDADGNIIASTDCAQTLVANETKVVAFEITDIGSPKEFDINYEITTKHKGKTEKLKLKTSSSHKTAKELRKPKKEKGDVNYPTVGNLLGKKKK